MKFKMEEKTFKKFQNLMSDVTVASKKNRRRYALYATLVKVGYSRIEEFRLSD